MINDTIFILGWSNSLSVSLGDDSRHLAVPQMGFWRDTYHLEEHFLDPKVWLHPKSHTFLLYSRQKKRVLKESVRINSTDKSRQIVSGDAILDGNTGMDQSLNRFPYLSIF